MSKHLDALMALVPAGVTAYDTNVPEPPPQRYLVFRAPTFKRDSEALSRASMDVNDYFSIMACGRDARQVRDLQEKVQDIYDRANVTVPGFKASVFLRTTGAVDIDRSKKPEIAHATDLYRYRATPA